MANEIRFLKRELETTKKRLSEAVVSNNANYDARVQASKLIVQLQLKLRRTKKPDKPVKKLSTQSFMPVHLL